MIHAELQSFIEILIKERTSLLDRWRDEVRALPSAKGLTDPTLNDHIPQLVEELVAALRARTDATVDGILADGTPPAHGLQRLDDGFDIVEVVAEYNILRSVIHDMAEEHQIVLRGRSLRALNRVLDGAIGLAVQTYESGRALEVLHRREEYLAFVAHDLRTPLNAISLAAKVLETALADDSELARRQRAQMFATLRRNAKRLAEIVDKVLDENTALATESGTTLERRQFDLWPLVEALVHDLHPVAGTGSTTLVNAVPEDLVVYGDAALLRRIFQNLIANAIAYTPRGTVTMGARTAPEDGSCVCWVHDDGTGIPPAMLATVFDKLATDPAAVGGHGLGLAIVKTFVEAHGGEVHVESATGMGTTFSFTLAGPPALRAQPGAAYENKISK